MNQALFIAALALALLGGCVDPAQRDAYQRKLAQDEAEARRGREYLAGMEIVRVCKQPEESFGQFVQRGANGRLWVSPYAKPTRWDHVEAVARDIQLKDIC